MSLELPTELELFVKEEVSRGNYATRDELIVSAINLLRDQTADLNRLRDDIVDGLHGEGIAAGDVFTELRGIRKPT